ncbi:hypothetical protein [Petrocella sp. FN5]|nr:hypothetical protein [Petrocella sp. FN5]MDF1617445.1 hypothetical protein [Petrocella sp. FN5]
MVMQNNNRKKKKLNPTLKAGIICVLAIAIIWIVMTYNNVW